MADGKVLWVEDGQGRIAETLIGRELKARKRRYRKGLIGRRRGERRDCGSEAGSGMSHTGGMKCLASNG